MGKLRMTNKYSGVGKNRTPDWTTFPEHINVKSIVIQQQKKKKLLQCL